MRTRRALIPLEEPYRSRAVPPGTPRYWSWLFAARDAREPLLGVYALMAEWRALQSPATEVGVARVKLEWWHDEMGRLAAGSPVHPITRFLAQAPCAATTDLLPLSGALEAAALQLAGAPLERATELESHADALYGSPLLVAARLAGLRADCRSVRDCVASLAAAEYLTRSIGDCRREARAGRIPFAVDELLAAEIDNEDLAAAEPPARLRTYLDQLRLRAAGYFSGAAQALAPEERPVLRHLLVLAALGARHLQRRTSPANADFRLTDLYNAWSTARRAAAAR